jgi:hypothetical protein
MPLKSGSSQETKSENIGELMKSYKKTGKIGTSKPKSEEKAQKQAAAVAYNKANESYDDKINAYLKKYIFEDKVKVEDEDGEEITPQDTQNSVKKKQDEINALKKAQNPNSPEAKAIAAVGGIKNDKNKKPALTSTL